MNVGDYVRTKRGISKCMKVTPIRENSFMYKFDKEVYEDVYYLTASELEKYKSSPNIIDLIEAGDYVNGRKIEELYCCAEYEGLGFDESDDSGRNYILLKEIDIKSIVTKECFERIEYKVGD